MRASRKDSDVVDGLDLKVLEILQRNGRASLREVSEKVGRPVSTVHERIRKMLQKGVIKGFTTLVDYEKLGYQVKALILANVEGKHIIDVEKHVASHPNVLAVYDITGEFDVAIIAIFKSISELDQFVKWLLQHPHIKQTRTSIVFRTVKETLQPPLHTALAESKPPLN